MVLLIRQLGLSEKQKLWLKIKDKSQGVHSGRQRVESLLLCVHAWTTTKVGAVGAHVLRLCSLRYAGIIVLRYLALIISVSSLCACGGGGGVR